MLINKIITPEYITQLKGKIFFNHSLSDYTSWKSGGPADCLYIPDSLEELQTFLKSLPSSVPVTYLGLGSNTLVRKKGVEGVVIVTQSGLNKITQVSETEVFAQAGVSSAQLARYTARLGLSGLEFLAGVPGTVGGALAMNAGCNGSETWEHVSKVDTINASGDILQRNLTDFSVSYRHVGRPPNEWFSAGYFKLSPSTKEAALKKIRDLLEHRNATQPTGTANCGSVFKNPPGDYAGRLIEQCGLKGKTLRSAQVSSKHANFIVNIDPDTQTCSEDIEQLILEVATIVLQKTSVRLIPEVCIIGRL